MQDITVHISRPQFEAKRRELLANGVDIPASGDNGRASSQGVVVAFYFQPAGRSGNWGELTLRLIEKPFFFPESAVESRIREWFNS